MAILDLQRIPRELKDNIIAAMLVPNSINDNDRDSFDCLNTSNMTAVRLVACQGCWDLLLVLQHDVLG